MKQIDRTLAIEILLDLYQVVTLREISKETGIDVTLLSKIVNKKRSMSEETASKLLEFGNKHKIKETKFYILTKK